MVTYSAACEDCQFEFSSGCDSTTHTVAERHAKVREHEVIYGSWSEPDRPTTSQEVHAMSPEQLEAINDSDVLCLCGANPREAESLTGWFVDTVLTPAGRETRVCCPECW